MGNSTWSAEEMEQHVEEAYHFAGMRAWCEAALGIKLEDLRWTPKQTRYLIKMYGVEKVKNMLKDDWIMN